jgi:HSP20 family protein
MGYIMKSTKRPTGNMPYLFDDFFTKDFFGINPGSFTQRAASPAVNIKETDGDFQLEVSAPGMKKDDFVLELDKNMLTISAEFKNEKEDKDETGDYTRREFNYSSFSRSFTLPEDKVNEEKIEATYMDGILYVTLPKKEVELVKEQKKLISVA